MRSVYFYMYNSSRSTACLSLSNWTSGDSGEPIFAERSDGDVDYCGVLNAHWLKDGYLYVYFTPYIYASASGFSIKLP